MKTSERNLLLCLLGVVCFTVATVFVPRALTWNARAQSDSMLKMLLGDGRRIFANHVFVQADVYFHSGYYPSIFDRRDEPKQSPMVQGNADHDEHHHDEHVEAVHDDADHDEDEHEREMEFLGKSRDWIDAFGRHFMVTEHTHLEGGKEREILPWLKLSAELDPQRVDSYTVAAYWLREKLGKPDEAEKFLREGLRNNPSSPEILFELGNLYTDNYHEAERGRNVWDLALRRWLETQSKLKDPDLYLLEKITTHLAKAEADAGEFDLALKHYGMAKQVSKTPEAVQKLIDEVNARKAAAAIPPKNLR